MNDLKKRILSISYKYKLSHLGSCLTAVDIIDEIYKIKKKNEPFVLSAGHSGLAMYCVIEKYGGRNAEDIYLHHGTHPDRCNACGLDCSTGSLGHGLPIAVGMALADRAKKVYCLISDGECAEGSIWEALRIIQEQELFNLKLYVNQNGWGAYKNIPSWPLEDRIYEFNVQLPFSEWRQKEDHNNIYLRRTDVEQFPFLKGQDAHYHVMTKEEYETAIC